MSGLRREPGARVEIPEDPFPVSLEKAETGWRVVAHAGKREARRK